MKKILVIIPLILLSVKSFSQTDNTQYREALKLKTENRFDESLTIFDQLLSKDSTKAEYLNNTAFLLCKLGNRQKTEASRTNYFQKAEYLSKKAIALDRSNAESHYTYALALARINEFASSKQKIANAKIIKTESETAIALNPHHGGAYHILGRWHRTIADFNVFEKAMVNAFFGGVPEGGSYDAAIDCFKKAIQFEPDYLLHKYELALTYHSRGNKDDDIHSKIWCNKILEITPKTADDKDTQAKAKALLNKLK